jgi:UDP-N-acetylglucosamine 2-epimerase (non-hydrolysing)
LRRAVLFIFGTRPEAIKLCPLLLKLRSFSELYSTKVCVTAQHRGMLNQVLTAFDVNPDYDLNVMIIFGAKA